MNSPKVQGIVQLVKNESRRLFSFGLIGGASLSLNVGLYALLSRILWPEGNRTLEYVFVVIIVTLINFEANRRFTFRSERSMAALIRFGLVAVIASCINTVLFYIGQEVLGLYDLAVIVCNTLLVAFFTFSSHRLFTFHPDPWRYVRGKKVEVGGQNI